MSDALGAYLNDHLAGATLGSDHARQLVDYCEGTPFAAEAERIAVEVEEDLQTLIDLMSHLDLTRNPIKQAGAWAAEKAGRIKFSGVTSDAEYGLFMALETMAVAVSATTISPPDMAGFSKIRSTNSATIPSPAAGSARPLLATADFLDTPTLHRPAPTWPDQEAI